MHRGSASRIVEQQWWRRRRGSGGGELPFGELGRCFVSPLWSVCFVHPGSGPFTSSSVAFYFLQQQRTCSAAAAVMTTVVGGKRTLLPATGTPCRVSRRIHHTASSNVQLNHREHDDRSQTLQLEFSSRIFYVSAGFCPHVKKTFDP